MAFANACASVAISLAMVGQISKLESRLVASGTAGLPIVNDEGSNFFYTQKATSATVLCDKCSL